MNVKTDAWGGYQDWTNRVGRYRHPGDGDIDWKTVFTKLTEHDCDVWAVLEWECCVKSPEQGAEQGVQFIKDHMIQSTNKTFDDFAGADVDKEQLKQILGL